MSESIVKNKYWIVFVDDEEKAAKYFQKYFGSEFSVIITTSPHEVLDLIEDRSREIAVVISDQRMPQINGVDLLTAVKEKNHNIVRILTTAYADLEDNIAAINKGNVSAYLSKPWDIEQVREVLRRSVDEYESRQNYLGLSGSIAHEMRNPLNSVRQSTEFAKEKLTKAKLLEKFCCDNEDEKITPLNTKDFNEILESLDIAFSSAKRGNILIDIILDSIRQKPVDTKSFRYFPISEILKTVMLEYSFKEDEKNRVIYDIKPDQDFSVKCNDILLSYVFFNLMKNSFYYVNSHPNLSVSIRTEIGVDEFNRIYIRDNGPGISAEKINNLFEVFSTSGKEGGTGLGLSFCKKTMHSFDGAISCNSVEGEFCEFILAFPKTAKKEKEQSSNRVLLIDDHKVSAQNLKDSLEQYLQSTNCDLASTGLKALEMLRLQTYDVVIIEIEIADIDGFNLAKQIREFDRTTPIIAYSFKNLEPISQKLESVGFNAYVAKFASVNLLIKAVAKWGLIRQEQLLLAEDEIKNFLKDKRILLADDENVNLILTAKYLEKFQVKVDEVRDGEEALNMGKQHQYDAILLDINMPELSGIAVAKKLREFQQKNNLKLIPILAFTGEGDKEKVHEILNSGFDDYFIKGGDYKYLMESITLCGIRDKSMSS